MNPQDQLMANEIEYAALCLSVLSLLWQHPGKGIFLSTAGSSVRCRTHGRDCTGRWSAFLNNLASQECPWSEIVRQCTAICSFVISIREHSKSKLNRIAEARVPTKLEIGKSSCVNSVGTDSSGKQRTRWSLYLVTLSDTLRREQGVKAVA